MLYLKILNGFQKALRQTTFLYKEVSITNARFSVNLDIYDGRMLDVKEIVATKDAKCVTKNVEDEHANEGTIRINPFVTTS